MAIVLQLGIDEKEKERDKAPMEINLGISSREETAAHKEGKFSHLLSLLDPERGYDGVVVPKRAKVMNLVAFHDIDDIEARSPRYLDCVAPTESHLVEIFKTFIDLRENHGEGILVHCEAGVSRSTAGAILGLCAVGMAPKEAFRIVTRINELGLPNRRMLRIGGKMLGDGGILLELAEAQRKYLFAKHGQEDPIESLQTELKHTPWMLLEWQRLQWRLRNLGRSGSAGSDHKMISRLKLKLAMTGKKNRKRG